MSHVLFVRTGYLHQPNKPTNRPSQPVPRPVPQHNPWIFRCFRVGCTGRLGVRGWGEPGGLDDASALAILAWSSAGTGTCTVVTPGVNPGARGLMANHQESVGWTGIALTWTGMAVGLSGWNSTWFIVKATTRLCLRGQPLNNELVSIVIAKQVN